jgi:hypothetical protein
MAASRHEITSVAKQNSMLLILLIYIRSARKHRPIAAMVSAQLPLKLHGNIADIFLIL